MSYFYTSLISATVGFLLAVFVVRKNRKVLNVADEVAEKVE